MSSVTTNYALQKPDYSDTADIGVINENMDAIDAQMKANADAAQAASQSASSALQIADNARQVADQALTADSALNAAKLTGTVPSACLPSFVDDVIEGYIVGATPFASDWLSKEAGGTTLTPETGKIYIVLTSGAYYNQTLRWGGTQYVRIDNPIDIATQSEAEAGTDNTKAMTPLRTKQAIDANAYELPTMSASSKGGAKVGSGLLIASDALKVNLSSVDNGTLAIARGGTGAASAAAARTNLGIDDIEARAMAQANGYYGGRDLAVLLGVSGDSLYAALHARASAANFSGLAVGDYMDVPCGIYGTRRFVIADFDPYYQCGDTAMGHHICFVDSTPVSMPSSDSYTINGSYIYWNTTATNQGTSAEASPYMASNLHAWETNNFLPAFPSALQGYMLNRRSLCETRYSASAALTASTGWAWKSIGKIWSLSEVEVYGCVAWGTPGWTIGESRHLEYFRASKHQLNGSRIHWWLRSVSGSSSSYVCYVTSVGYADHRSATSTWIRPRCGFLLG